MKCAIWSRFYAGSDFFYKLPAYFFKKCIKTNIENEL